MVILIRYRRWGVIFATLCFLYVLGGYGCGWFLGLVGKEALPPHLKSLKHDDWFVLKNVPRGLTAGRFVEPPRMMLGNQHGVLCRNGRFGPKPIPANGEYQLSLVQVRAGWPFYLPYFAITIHRCHFRIGCRWDDVDHYYVIPSFVPMRWQSWQH